MNYYYSKKGELYGPKTWQELDALYRTGEITAETPICLEGQDTWTPLSDLSPEDESSTTTTPELIEPPPSILPSVTYVAPPQLAKFEYAVVPFVALIGQNANSGAAAKQLQALIKGWSQAGWEYVRLESVETVHAGDDGCFGFGATPPRRTVYSMVVFKK